MKQLPSTPVVTINPNLRLDGDLTMVDLDEDVEGGPLLLGTEVEVRGTGLVGVGRVVAIDKIGSTAYIRVEWGMLHSDYTA